jgi:short-subunit dehydrogenase involved in D-alanine esterification of teichoic acids
MKCAITGHTKGIGKALFDYFSGKGEVVGFSRTIGYDISKEIDRYKIVNLSDDCDIFINNAYSDLTPNSQLELLRSIHEKWRDQEKIIINISSRFTDSNHVYSVSKKAIDNYCSNAIRDKVYIINIKPGLTDTLRVRDMQGSKMSVHQIVEVLEFILLKRNQFRIHNITFGL